MYSPVHDQKAGAARAAGGLWPKGFDFICIECAVRDPRSMRARAKLALWTFDQEKP